MGHYFSFFSKNRHSSKLIKTRMLFSSHYFSHIVIYSLNIAGSKWRANLTTLKKNPHFCSIDKSLMRQTSVAKIFSKNLWICKNISLITSFGYKYYISLCKFTYLQSKAYKLNEWIVNQCTCINYRPILVLLLPLGYFFFYI